MLARLLALLTVLGLSLSVPAVAMGQSLPPAPPHIFIGRATVDGTPAGDGTVITARSEGLVLAQAALAQGRYVLMAPQPIGGQSISFAIGDFPADQTATWAPGGASLLDLTATARPKSTGLPHVFTGRAMVDGVPPAEGTGITAWNDDMILAKARLVQGRFVLLVPQPSNGQTIAFAIGDQPADQTAAWAAGGASLLDLTTQMSRPPLATVLDTLENSLVRVFHRDRQTGIWTYFDPLINPGDRNRFRLTPGQEYWVKLDHDQLVSHHNRETRLLAGWNVVVW